MGIGETPFLLVSVVVFQTVPVISLTEAVPALLLELLCILSLFTFTHRHGRWADPLSELISMGTFGRSH